MPVTTVKTIFRFKRGFAARLAQLNPLLDQGEPGFEIDTFKLKIGDGITYWNDLPYINDNTELQNELRLLEKTIQENYTTKAYVEDLLEELGLSEGLPSMVALTSQEILDICK